jgi:hypothetical protein
MLMLSQFVPPGLMLPARNWYLYAKVTSSAPLMLLSSAELMWGAVAISPCVDLYAKFLVHLLRELLLPLLPGLFGLLSQRGA